MSTTDTTTASAQTLRAAMVAELRKSGRIRSDAIEQAMLATPRHAFVPDADLADAYRSNRVVVTHRYPDGRTRSSASAPWLVAAQLEQLQIQPGDHILEIGAGTGYNAALMDHLTGPTGQVTTIDIDPDVTRRARTALDTTGHPDVSVITGDGALGYPDHAPYNKMIITVSPWDIPQAWWGQLAPDARMVVPLRWRGQSRSIAFAHTAGHLVSDTMELCGFVYLESDDHEGEVSGPITQTGQVTVHCDRDQPIHLDALTTVLDQPRITAWSGVTLGPEEYHDGLWLRLTVTEPRVCRIQLHGDVPPEVCDPVRGWWRLALAEHHSLAYLTSRPSTYADTERELGAIGHGPHARELADRLCDRIRTWAPTRDQLHPTLTLHPINTPEPDGPAIEKTHSRLVLTFDLDA